VRGFDEMTGITTDIASRTDEYGWLLYLSFRDSRSIRELKENSTHSKGTRWK
jgi:hypothetical protein